MKSKLWVNCQHKFLPTVVAATLLVVAAVPVFAKKKSTVETATQVVVTIVDHTHNAAPNPSIQKNNIKVKEDGKLLQVLDWQPITGPGSTQLVLLIDDSLQARVSVNFDDLREFIQQLPPSVQVAVGYMEYGNAVIVAGFQASRDAAAKSIRLPTGIIGVNASPYFCLSALARHWPDQGRPIAVRQVLMITDGIDRYYSARSYDPEDPYVGAAIHDLQSNRIIISPIYFRDRGFVDRGINASYVGWNYLTQLADATGGKMYDEGLGNPVTFVSFLKDYNMRLVNPYMLTFMAKGRGLQNLDISGNEHGIRLEAPEKVTVGQQLP